MRLILGGPGCGKTHFLLDVIAKRIDNGIMPSQIAYLPFTRKAATEGRERAMKRFGLAADALPHFRTIHSFALHGLGLNHERLMKRADYKEFAEFLGLEIEQRWQLDDEIGGTEDDRCLNAYELSRTMKIDLPVMCERLEVAYPRTLYIKDKLDQYKADTLKVDFTQLLERYIDEGIAPKLKTLIIDEAQDLTRLQWEVIKKISGNADEIIIAGDDDQAIFEWAGADLSTFLKLDGRKYVLPRSYRLRRNVFDVCKSVVQNIQWRHEKNFRPVSDGGNVWRVNDFRDIELNDESWYMLARHHRMLPDFYARLYSEGRGFIDAHGNSSFDTDEARAIVMWNKLQDGELLRRDDVKTIYAKLPSGMIDGNRDQIRAIPDDKVVSLDDLVSQYGLLHHGTNWENAISMSSNWKNYYSAAINRGEDMLATPKIHVSTIHAVKGGEADNVIICPDISRKAENSLRRNPSTESRVFYVGASRAKNNLFILREETPRFYRIGAKL